MFYWNAFKVQLLICPTTLSAMCYLFYYTECSFLLVSFFFMNWMPWISIAVVFKCVKLWYLWCVINKITYIFCICKYFSAILVYVLYRWVFLNFTLENNIGEGMKMFRKFLTFCRMTLLWQMHWMTCLFYCHINYFTFSHHFAY
jgi:hypothetical protein